MSIKMVLIPIERLKAYERKSTDTLKQPPDIELKLMMQRKARRSKKSTVPVQPQNISLDKEIDSYTKAPKNRAKDAVKHLNDNRDRLKFDKNTGEFSYDGIKAVDSDIRELVSTLTSNSKRKTDPKGWELFVQSLEDSEAPSDIYGGWQYEKAAKGDWAALK